MKQQERFEDQQEALRIVLEGWQSGLWTALPCEVESFDSTKQTCSLQPTIQGVQTAKDGSLTYVNMPLLVDVPVYRFRGGGFILTVPIVKGDEGLVVFASRCIDTWWQSGGLQKPFERRMHDLSDGFFLPGFNSQTKNITAFATTGIELRNDAGDTKITLKNNEIDIVATNIKITGDVAITGKLTSTDESDLAGGAKLVVLDGDPVSGGVVHSSATKTKAT